jgi:hypothetical protein
VNDDAPPTADRAPARPGFASVVPKVSAGTSRVNGEYYSPWGVAPPPAVVVIRRLMPLASVILPAPGDVHLLLADAHLHRHGSQESADASEHHHRAKMPSLSRRDLLLPVLALCQGHALALGFRIPQLQLRPVVPRPAEPRRTGRSANGEIEMQDPG